MTEYQNFLILIGWKGDETARSPYSVSEHRVMATSARKALRKALKLKFVEGLLLDEKLVRFTVLNEDDADHYHNIKRYRNIH